MPRLAEQERQEIVRYIKADKPLPAKMVDIFGNDTMTIVEGTI